MTINGAWASAAFWTPSSEFRTWEEGFDAATRIEKFGGMAVCPYIGQQAELWQNGFAASRRITELGKEGI